MPAKKLWKPTRAYMEAVGALYGDGQVTRRVKRKSPTKPSCPTEEVEQIRTVEWLKQRGYLFYAIPNGRTNGIEGAKYRRQGAQAGVLDICVCEPTKRYHGLYIEMKRVEGGVVSEAQKDWITKLTAKGYCAVVARGFEEAKIITLDYLGEKE